MKKEYSTEEIENIIIIALTKELNLSESDTIEIKHKMGAISSVTVYKDEEQPPFNPNT